MVSYILFISSTQLIINIDCLVFNIFNLLKKIIFYKSFIRFSIFVLTISKNMSSFKYSSRVFVDDDVSFFCVQKVDLFIQFIFSLVYEDLLILAYNTLIKIFSSSRVFQFFLILFYFYKYSSLNFIYFFSDKKKKFLNI